MKKQICSVLTALAGMTGLSLYGVEIPVINETQFKIVKYQTEDEDELVKTINVTIPAKSTKKISVPDKGVEYLYFIFDNGKKVGADFGEIKDVRSIKFTYVGKFNISYSSRNRRTKYPVGQVKFSLAKEAKEFLIAPIGTGKWTTCKLVDAKQNLYEVPTTGKYEIKVVSNLKGKKDGRFSLKKTGYDFRKVSSIKISYTDISCDVDEDDDDE